MSRYTVSWTASARKQLTEMWLDNVESRQDISDASDQIERALAVRPRTLGTEFSPNVRFVALPPLVILFRISDDDRLVRVIHVQFWDD